MQIFSPLVRAFAEKIPVDTLELAAWRRRVATFTGAVLIGLVALGFAKSADLAQRIFDRLLVAYPYAPVVITPAVFVLCAWLTRRYAPGARGSGIPQVIAVSNKPDSALARDLLSMKTAILKAIITLGTLLGGASVGREGPTVQLGTAVMVASHRLLGARLTSGVLIAGGAAGVAAAFNTPIAGIAFAIEELASAYEQRVAVLVMGAVMIAGMTTLGLAGNYVYFGSLNETLPLSVALLAAPLAGLVGGAFGGLFSRLLLWLTFSRRAATSGIFARPMLFAFVCGVIVAGLGLLTHGATWGTGYGSARSLLEGEDVSLLLGPAKLIATLVTSASGLPGGIFSPSLAAGAGFGQLVALPFPPEYAGGIILLGMAGYFTGVVRAPLTGVIILTETTGNSGAIIPLFFTALIADWAGSRVCKPRLYHALSRDFQPRKSKTEAEGEDAGESEARS